MGIENFWPAQRADHLIVGLRQLLNNQTSVRLELFQKQIENVRPRFENLYNPLGVIPELQADRVRLDPALGPTGNWRNSKVTPSVWNQYRGIPRRLDVSAAPYAYD